MRKHPPKAGVFVPGRHVVYLSLMTDTVAHINQLLDKVRPYVQMHGGDVQLLRVEEGTAYLKVYGACVDCGLASVTYNKTIAPLLIKEVEEITKVVFE
jgi:Fe-S cluster biogenesis protein NfuA